MVELTACSLYTFELNSSLDSGWIDSMQFRYLELNSGLDNGGIDIMQFICPWVEQWFG